MLAWVRAARPLAHANIAPPLVLGQALAFAVTGAFSWRSAALVHAIGLLDHLVIVFTNDLADRETDADNQTYSLVSGGSRVLVEGALSPRAVGRAAWLAVAGLLALGLGWAPQRPALAWLVPAALALIWAYSCPPLRLSYRGGGEWLQALGLGVVLPLIGYVGQAGSLAAMPWDALLPLLLLGLGGHVVTALPDRPSDARAAKRTIPVRIGLAPARWLALLLIAVGAGLTALVGPPLPTAWRALVVAPPLLALLTSLLLIGRAAPERPRAMLAFALLTGGAISLVWLGWAAALVASRLPS